MLILGIDEAGRGPLIGPMIIAGVLITKMQENKLKKERVRDSKIVPQHERIKLAKTIKENLLGHVTIKVNPEEIDNSLASGTNLNTLEAIKGAQAINTLNTGKFRKEKIKVVVDCPSNNKSAWAEKLLSFIGHKGNLDLICEHKADANYVAVSAASILAKVIREEEIAKLKKIYGEFGSGYPSDPITQNFLKNNGKKLINSGIFRKNWHTWKKLFPDKGQATLDIFG